MKDFIRITIYFIFLFVLVASCHEDMIEEVVVIDEFTPVTIYEVDVRGIVSDDNGNPISSATIQVDGETLSTDELGVFLVQNLRANPRESKQITIESDGFLPVSRLINVLSENTIHLNITMIPIPPEESFSAENGYVAQVSESATITFFENGIVSDGRAYTGEVFLRSFHLAKDDDQLFQRLPGDLVGLDQEETLQQLETYGMIYATLVDENGNELQPDPSVTALLTIDIPEDYLGVAPSQMPLWYFDETTGVWLEEGIAIRNGNTYEGAVTHFSWWNIDIPVNYLVNVCLTVTNENTGEPLINTQILFSSSIIEFGTQTTNGDGGLCVSLPGESEINLSLFSECRFADSSTIGPFSSNQDNVNVSLGISEDGIINISGSVTDCESNAIAAETLTITRSSNRQVVAIDPNGNYNFDLICPAAGEALSFLIIDSETNSIKGEQLIIENTDNNIEFNFNTCEEVDNILSGDIFGTSVALLIEKVQSNPNETILVLDNDCYLSFLGNSTGTFDGAYFCGLGENGEVSVTVTQYGNIVSGTFMGADLSGSFSASLN
jgi:hypothetical protein